MKKKQYYRKTRTSASKYHNRKTKTGFDSVKEENRYEELLLMEKAGMIFNLRRQVKFQLTPTVREPDRIGPRGGRKPGKVILNESSYVADFVYVDAKTGQLIVEDVKGYRGGEAYKLFTLKKKYFYQKYRILIQEV